MEDGIAKLQAKYEETSAKKEELVKKCSLCTARLERAEKVSKKMLVCKAFYVHALLYDHSSLVVLLMRK